MSINNKDWQAAFGEVPDRFSNRVRSTVQHRQAQVRPIRKYRVVLALAASLMLFVGTALALHQLGVLDTLTSNLREFLQPEAHKMVQTNIDQQAVQPQDATFTMEEVVYDGHQIYATIRVRANDKKATLLMDMQAEPSMSMDWWVSHDFYSGQTFSGNASKTKRTLTKASFYVEVNGQPTDLLACGVRYEDEDILYNVHLATNEQDKAFVKLYTSTYRLYQETRNNSAGELTFDVSKIDKTRHYTTTLPIALPKAGGRLTEFRLEQTPIATYLYLSYEPEANLPDGQLVNWLDGLWVNWLDQNGEAQPEGNWQTGLEETENGGYLLTQVFRAFETLPETMNLEFYNGMSKERFDILTIPVKEK